MIGHQDEGVEDVTHGVIEARAVAVAACAGCMMGTEGACCLAQLRVR